MTSKKKSKEDEKPQTSSAPTETPKSSKPSATSSASGQKAGGSEQPKQPKSQSSEPEKPVGRDSPQTSEQFEQIRRHNERTGGGPVKPDAVQAQLDEHNRRVGDASR